MHFLKNKAIILCFLGFCFIFVLALTTNKIEAVSNQTITFQGKLVNIGNGTNLVPGSPSCIIAGSSNDTCDFRVNIYSDLSGGTLLYREPHSNVEIENNNGVFNLSINSVCNNWIAPGGTCSGTGITWGADDTIYLEIEFDTDGNADFAGAETFSRKLLTSVPYAYYADSAGSVSGGLDTIYDNDSDKVLNVDNISGLEFLSSVTGNMIFDLQSTGDLVLEDNNTAFLTISDLGAFDYTLDSTDNPGFIINNLGTNSFRINDQTSDTSPFVVNQNGNVGIGTANPTEELEVIRSTANDPFVVISAAGNTTYNPSLRLTGGFLDFYSTFQFLPASGDLLIRNDLASVPGGDIFFQTFGSNNRMIIASSGSIGIGPSISPSALLELDPSDLGTADALRINPFGTSTGNTGNIQFMELAANGTNYVGFTAPDSISSNQIWTLPNADGSNGQVLSTDGLGVLSWVSNGASIDLDGAYVNDSDKILNINNALGLEFLSTSTSDMSFDLQATGDLTFQDNNSTFLTINDLGGFDYILDSTDSPSFILNNLGTGNFRVNDQASDATPFIIDQSGLVGVGTATPTAFVDVAAANTLTSSMRVRSSAGVNPSTPNSGDIWWNGTNFNFYNGTSSIDLLANATGTFINFAPNAVQNSTNNNSLINISSSGNVGGNLININETGIGSPDLFTLQVAGTDRFSINNGGNITDTLGVESISANGRILMNSSANNALDWETGSIYDSSGTEVINWQNMSLYDIAGIRSIYWNNRNMFDSIGQLAIDWQARIAYDSSNIDSIDWQNRTLFDATGTITANWNTRTLGNGAWTVSNLSGVGNRLTYVNASGVLSASTIDPSTVSVNATALTNGSVLFANGGGQLAQDNTNLYFDDTNNRLRIGTATNTAFINIAPSTTAQASLRLITSAGVNPSTPNSGDIWWNGTNLYFRTAGTTLDILPSLDNAYDGDADKVLGVDNALGLEFLSSVAGNISFDLQSTGDFVLQDNNSTFLTIDDIGGFSYTLDSTDNPSFTIENLGTGSFIVNDTVGDLTPFIIDQLGNVGIGTASTADKLRILLAESTTSNSSASINYNQVTNAANITGAALNVSIVSSGDAGDTIYGANFTNNTATASTEYALNIGTGYDRDINFNNTNAQIGVVNNGTLGITDGTNNILEFKDLSTNFGASLETGAVISRNSYIGEEFSRDRADLTADGNQTWGDYTQFGVDENTVCTFSTLDDTVNGIGRVTVGAAASNCLAYHSSAAGNAHLQFDADNLPVIVMKARASNTAAADDFWIGLGTDAAASAVEPTSGIYFTNDNGADWTGVTRSAGVSTPIACGVAVSPTNFALLKIEVVSITSVRFYIDANVSDGVSWTLCGTSTANIPTAGLTSMLKINSATAGRTLDVDYWRVWQDDSIENQSSVDQTPTPAANPADTIEETFQQQTEDTSVVENTEEIPVSFPVETEVINKIINPTEFTYSSLFSNTDNIIILKSNESINSLSLEFTSVKISSILSITGAVEIAGNLNVNGAINTSDGIMLGTNSSGEISLSIGQQEYEVKFSKPRAAAPLVFISIIGDYDYNYKVIDKNANGFKIKIDRPAEQDITFNWMVINL